MSTVTELAQDGGGSLLPDWLADAPPWVQALAIVGAILAVLAVPTAPMWAPALADRIRGRQATPPPPPETGSSEAPVDSPTTRRSAPAHDADAKMALIDRLVAGLEKSLEDAESQVSVLQRALETVQAQLAQAREEISRLTWQRDRLLEQRLPLDPPRRGRSPEH